MIKIEENALKIEDAEVELDNGEGDLVSTNLAIISLDEYCNYINGWAEGKGWNNDPVRPAERIALMHSELSEALEQYRDGTIDTYIKLDDKGREKPEGYWIELADCVIRIMHDFGQAGRSLNLAMAMKMSYNEKRPYRHGGKVI